MMVKRKTDPPDFLADLEGELFVDEPMSKHTSWRSGGTADYFYTPENRADLLALLAQLPLSLPVTWVGLGSNLLVRDGGIRGIVIRTSKGLREIKLLDGKRVYAESGVSSAKVARFSTANSLTGVEFLAGVPGSFGGALAMNAGAFGVKPGTGLSQLNARTARASAPGSWRGRFRSHIDRCNCRRRAGLFQE